VVKVWRRSAGDASRLAALLLLASFFVAAVAADAHPQGRAKPDPAGEEAPRSSGEESGKDPRRSNPKAPCLTADEHTVCFGVDLSVVSIQDESTRATMGREHQIKLSYVVMSADGKLNDRVSYRIEVNPASDSVEPRPYVPSPADRRTYFFPNQPDQPGSRGVVSDPRGLSNVDDYKHLGTDPILQQGMLRIGYVDLHAASGRFGLRLGRFYVPQGIALSDLHWFTAKDLTHIQSINAQADNGAVLYFARAPLRADIAVITGNASPYHDYGYFDFTGAAEDKNSAVGAVMTVRMKMSTHGTIGGSLRRNYLNSRIEDATTLQLSKHNDNAAVLFGEVRPVRFVRLFGEYARYTWGLAKTSADLLPGPRVQSPVIKAGYYVGVDAYAPRTRLGRWGVSITREVLSRDDSLVAWAAANDLFGVTMGKKEHSVITKVFAEAGPNVTAFFFLTRLQNPFPELSAIVPVAGPEAGAAVSNTKYGFGVRFTF
jgi:hypothetical protein